jgi:hypothetical protein
MGNPCYKSPELEYRSPQISHGIDGRPLQITRVEISQYSDII